MLTIIFWEDEIFRSALDKLYKYSGVSAAFFILLIVVIVSLQVCLNIIEKIYSAIFGSAIGLTIPSYSDFTGFFLAAASFLALAYTLRSGSHIRVTLVIGLVNAKFQRFFEFTSILIGLCMTAYASYYMFLMIQESIEYNDMTSGMVSIPIWIPQMPVLIGLVILAISLLDELILVINSKPPTYEGQSDKLLSE